MIVSILRKDLNTYKNKNVYDITSVEEIHNIISEYVNNAVTLLFTPSYVYPPLYRTNHEISIFLVDFTAVPSSDAIDRYISVDLIERSFRHLIPYAEWTSNVMSLRFSELSEDLQETILSGMEFISFGGSNIGKSLEF